MSLNVLILIFFGSLLLIFGIGIVIGKLFKLDRYLDDLYNRPHKIE